MSESEAIAKLWGLIGVRYVEHGDDENGMDCWGLIRYAFRLRGVQLPRDPNELDETRKLLSIVDGEPKPYDVAYFTATVLEERHVGLYIGNGEVIAALNRDFGVATMRLSLLRTATLYRYGGFA